MPLQDLTPQLRTRLSRMERLVGWFVFLATLLLLFGFGYYLYHTAEDKGWFKIKAKFHVYVKSSAGLKVADPVVMMGFPVGQITRIHAMPPRDPHNVEVEFEIVEPAFRYIWTGGSYVLVNSAGLLGARQLEVTRATNGYAICVTQPVLVFSNLDELRQKVVAEPGQWQLSQDVFDPQTNLLFHAYDTLTESNLDVITALKPDSLYAYNNRERDRHRIVASWHPRTHRYENFTPNSEDAWLKVVETPAVSDQLQGMVSQVQGALPAILALTNTLTTILNNASVTLGNAALITSNLNTTVLSAQPMLANFTGISSQLKEPGGALTWAMGTNGNQQFQSALTNVNVLLTDADTNLDTLGGSLGETLDNVANITSNLNAQVQANSNILWNISKTITDSDTFIQGLKRHWLLRSAFKKENKTTNAPAATNKK